MLVKEMDLGPTKVRFFDDECVSSAEEIEEILKNVSRIVQNDYAAREMKKREDTAF